MAYLEQFARNKRRKEKSEVLTARLPKSLYGEFKTYCDELGLSISEAVYLLVEREINENKGTARSELSTTLEVQPTTRKTKPTTKSTTPRFIRTPWIVDGKLPCPICREWRAANNFSRHAKTHGITTEQLLTGDDYKDIVNEMIAERKSQG